MRSSLLLAGERDGALEKAWPDTDCLGSLLWIVEEDFPKAFGALDEALRIASKERTSLPWSWQLLAEHCSGVIVIRGIENLASEALTSMSRLGAYGESHQ